MVTAPVAIVWKPPTKNGNMELFKIDAGPAKNLLTKDGTVHYYGQILAQEKADQYLDKLLTTIPWENDQAIIFGKPIYYHETSGLFPESQLLTLNF